MKTNLQYTVSPSTANLINVLKAFDEVYELLSETVCVEYARGEKIMEEYFNLANNAREYLLNMIAVNIDTNLGMKKGNTEI